MFRVTDTGRLECPDMERETGLRALMSLSDEDLGWKTNPDPDDVIARTRRLVAELGAPDRTVYFPQQVHGNIVRPLGGEEALPLPGGFFYVPGCDGLVTDRSDVVIASQYADCTPIVLACPGRAVFGVVHSGWRGTLGRIASRAVARIGETYGVPPSGIVACIWPGIGADDFEVSEDVAERFRAEFPGFEAPPFPGRGSSPDPSARALPYWMTRKGDKYLIDTHEINRRTLEALGVAVRVSRGWSTFSDLRFHSYRRDKEHSGRMVLAVTHGE